MGVGAAEGCSGGIGVGHLAVQDLGGKGNNGAVAGGKLSLRSNGRVCHMVGTVPAPDPDGQADQSLRTGECSLANTLNGNGQGIGDLIQAVFCLEAGSHLDPFRLPGIGSLQVNGRSQGIHSGDVCHIDIRIVDGIILGRLSGIIVAGQGHSSVTADGKGPGDLAQVAQLVLDLEADGVDTGIQLHIVAGHHGTGNSGLQRIAIHQNNAGSSVQAGIVSHIGRERHGGAADHSAVFQGHCGISSGIGHIADGGQDPVLHSGGVVQGKIIEVEGQICGLGGLDIVAHEAGLTAGSAHGIHQGIVILAGQICTAVDPAGFGDIRLSDGVQVLVFTGGGPHLEVQLGKGDRIGIRLGVNTQLHSQTGGTLRNIDPGAEGGGILAVCHVTQNGRLTGVEEHIVGPAGKLGIGIVQGHAQGAVAVLHLAVAFGGQEGLGIAVLGVVAVVLDRSSSAHLSGPVIHLVHAQEQLMLAVLEVEEDLRALAEGNRQHSSLGFIRGVCSGHIHAGNALIGGCGQGVAIQGCSSVIRQSETVDTVNAHIPVVCTVLGNQLQVQSLAVGQNSFLLGKGEYLGVNHVQNRLAHNLFVVNSLNGSGAGCGTGGKHTALDGAHALLSDLIGHLSGDIHGKILGIQAGDLEGHGCAGRNVVICSLDQGLFELTGGTGGGDQDHRIDGGTLGTVGGDGAHGVLSLAGTLGNEGGGAAAVTVDCIDAAQCQHGFAHLIVGQTGGHSAVTAIHLAEDQGAVFLDADHGTGGIGGVALHSGGGQGTVLHQPAEVGGDGGLLFAGQGSGHGAQLTGAIPIDGQIGLCAAVDLGRAQDHAVPDHVAVGGIGVIGQGGVHGAHNIVAQSILVVGHGLGHFHGLPNGGVTGQIIGVQLVNAVVAGHDLQLFLSGIHLEDVDHLPVRSFIVVQDDLLLNGTGSQIVGLGGDHIEILIRHRGVIVCCLSKHCHLLGRDFLIQEGLFDDLLCGGLLGNSLHGDSLLRDSHFGDRLLRDGFLGNRLFCDGLLSHSLCGFGFLQLSLFGLGSLGLLGFHSRSLSHDLFDLSCLSGLDACGGSDDLRDLGLFRCERGHRHHAQDHPHSQKRSHRTRLQRMLHIGFPPYVNFYFPLFSDLP